MHLVVVVVLQVHGVLSVKTMADPIRFIEFVHHFVCVLFLCGGEDNDFEPTTHFFQEPLSVGSRIEPDIGGKYFDELLRRGAPSVPLLKGPHYLLGFPSLLHLIEVNQCLV